MSQTNPADPYAVAQSHEENIAVPDDSASRFAGTKRAPGRPASDAWTNFKRIPNPNPGNSKRKYLGVCKDCGQKVTAKPEDLRKHASNCRKSDKETRLASPVQQTKAGGGGGDSSQLSIDSYRDSTKLSKGHNKALQRLLVLAIVMCGIPFACFVQPAMKHFLHCMRPSFDLPGIVRLFLVFFLVDHPASLPQ